MAPDVRTAAAFDAEVYEQMQRFYARQMQLLDNGAVDEWALTLTQDAMVTHNGPLAPASGRAAILAVAGNLAAATAGQGVVKRHWTNMLTVERVDEDEVIARLYLTVVASVRGGSAELDSSAVCRDILVRRDGEWQVSSRHMTHDSF